MLKLLADSCPRSSRDRATTPPLTEVENETPDAPEVIEEIDTAPGSSCEGSGRRGKPAL
jgi:hypothetical protein